MESKGPRVFSTVAHMEIWCLRVSSHFWTLEVDAAMKYLKLHHFLAQNVKYLEGT